MHLKRFLFPLFLLIVGITLFFASWSVLHGDINFISDVARDMFLFEEILEKKLILIGPRASVGGLFHGPLWSYLTLPGFLLGNGNPVVVGWYWIGLITLTLAAWYIVFKRMFGSIAAMCSVLYASLYFVFHSNSLFNPDGALFLIPIFFYTVVRYEETVNINYLLGSILLLGAIIQFQMAIGVPFLILLLPIALYIAIREKKLTHMLTFLLIPILLSNFLLFDLRHEHILVNNTLRHLGTHDSTSTMASLLSDRITYLYSRIEFLRFGPPNGQIYASFLFATFLFIQIVQNVHRKKYLLFLYFLLGYFALSLLNRYNLLTHYVSPLVPFIFLMFGSLATSKFPKVFFVLFAIMYGLNIVGAKNYIQSLNRFIGYDQYSWKALHEATSTLVKGEEGEFGYFVYAPDIVGYGPRYAMHYANRMNGNHGRAFEKKPVTYLFIEPAARNNAFTSKDKWKRDQIHITSTPTLERTFYNGYSFERHELTEDEQKQPFDPGVNPGLHYR